MGNAQCVCYNKNKKVCVYCQTEYCGSCLTEKKLNIKHTHSCMVCHKYLDANNGMRTCSCEYCIGHFNKDILTLQIACYNCIGRYGLEKCRQFYVHVKYGQKHYIRKSIIIMPSVFINKS